MITKRLYTVDDLIALGCEDYDLIDGELREMGPTTLDASCVAIRIGAPVFHFVEEHQLGVVFGADGGFHLPGPRDTVVAPDVAFLNYARIPPGHDFQSFFSGAPDLAVEVTSLANPLHYALDKVRRYLAAGARLVWVVRLDSRSVDVYHPGRAPETYRENDVLDGEDVLPGFRLPLSAIFTSQERESSNRV